MENLIKLTAMNDTAKTVAYIKDVVAAYYYGDGDVYENKSRKQEAAKIKQIAVLMCYETIKVTRSKIGSFFGYKHDMVIYIVKKYKGYLDWDVELKKELAEIREIIKFKVADGLNLNNMYYYIPLNDFTSIKFGKDKSIILQGFTEDEISKIKFNKIDEPEVERRKHKNQKFYILEKKENEKNDNPS
jgi:hypothetical protein